MTNKEIEKFKQELYEIQRISESPQQLEPIKALAKRIGAPIPHWLTERGQPEFINEIIRHIHIVLQTEEMFNACVFAKWSCLFAAIAAIAACISIVLVLFFG
jgi:hypothetical protein